MSQCTFHAREEGVFIFGLPCHGHKHALVHTELHVNARVHTPTCHAPRCRPLAQFGNANPLWVPMLAIVVLPVVKYTLLPRASCLCVEDFVIAASRLFLLRKSHFVFVLQT